MPDEDFTHGEYGLPSYQQVRELCPVLELCNLFGRNWVFPLFTRLEEGTWYSFHDLLALTSKKMPKSSLSNALHKLEELDLVESEDNLYRVTSLGISLRENLLAMKKNIANHHPDRVEHCRKICREMGFFTKDPL